MSTSENTPPFAFTAENLEKCRAVIAKYPQNRQQSAVMPILDIAQRQDGWVSVPAMDHVADMLGMDPIRVYEVATFYTMFQLKPIGRHHIQVCTNLPCMLRGVDDVVESCRKTLGIDFGETTPDGLFTLSEVECLGACVNAPVVWIGDDYYEDLDAASTADILDALKRGETPKAGSQIGRQGACPDGGPTTLTEAPAKTGGA